MGVRNSRNLNQMLYWKLSVKIQVCKFNVYARASYGGIKMQRFYNLLIVDNMNIDDLGTMHKEKRQDVKEIRDE